MLDIKFIRENKDLISAAAKKKHIEFNVEELLEVDKKRLELLSKVEALRGEQNKFSDKIAGIADSSERTTLIEEMRTVKEDLKKNEEELKETVVSWQKLMLHVPNVPDMSVPEGNSDADNVEVRKWGKKPEFSFQPKSHIELMKALDMVDFERGTKVAGFRGYFLKNDAVLLSLALWNFVQKHFVEKGFNPMIVPSMVKREVFMGTGYLPQGEEDLYKTQDGDYLAGTAEVATMGYFMDEVLDKKQLPLKFISFSPCFRREAGAHGKDTQGLIRVHEFYKWEQVVFCEASHEESVRHHEDITLFAEELLQKLGLHHHVVANCGADLGQGQVKKYDAEAWMPGEGKYRETGSSSYFHDFQTRRLNIRYKDDDGKLRFAHSLNNTALSGRPLLAIVENYQNEDGSITVPEVLRPFMGKDRISR